MVVPPRVPVEPRTIVLVISGFSAVLLVALVALLPVPYAILRPGPVLNTLGKANGRQLITISGHQSYPSKGQLDLTTVSVEGGPGFRVSLIQTAWGWLRRDQAVVPVEQVYDPNQTQQQTDALNRAEMVSSQESATAAALSSLDIPVPTTLRIHDVEPSAPSAAVLRSGDVLLGLDGTTLADLAVMRAVLEAKDPGDPVSVTVRRDGKQVTLTTRTTRGADGQTILGIFIDPVFTFPFTVKIQIEDIGGPSAGMMFALGIIDVLTPGDLTGGKRVAGTGTIDADGSVGPIGGIQQKMEGAHRAGADWFLAPADNCSEVRDHVPHGLHVARVGTLDQAMSAVEAIAAGRGGSLAGC